MKLVKLRREINERTCLFALYVVELWDSLPKGVVDHRLNSPMNQYRSGFEAW